MRRRSWSGRTQGEEPSPDSIKHDPAKQRSAARNTAIGLLARREHAQAEIKRKLRDRGYDSDVTLEVIDDLTRQRLLSDTRFAEMLIRSRANRGHGPVRLKAELRQLQIPVNQIEAHLAAAGVNWAALARDVRQRKFGEQAPAAMSERAKQMRFLQYRGFTAEQIRAALGTHCEDDLLDVGDDGQLSAHSPDIDSEI